MSGRMYSLGGLAGQEIEFKWTDFIQKKGGVMDTSAKPNPELRKATQERKKQPGYRCLGKQRDGNFALSVGVPTGNFSPDALRKLAEVIEEYGNVGHLSTAQSIIIVGIAEQNFYDAREAVMRAGFDVRSIGRDFRQIKCCPGADYSPFGLQRTIPLAEMLEESFRGLPTPVKFKSSISGCPHCCANTMMNDFGIHGMVDGWKVFIGGKMGTVPEIAKEIAASVSSDDIPKYLASVLRVYRDKGEPNERLSKTISRMGFDLFKQEVEALLDKPYDDLITIAKETREKIEASHCVGPLRH